MHERRPGLWLLRSPRCRCGLPWPCQDADLEALRDHYAGQGDNIGAWRALTRRDPGGNDASGPATTRRQKRDNSGNR